MKFSRFNYFNYFAWIALSLTLSSCANLKGGKKSKEDSGAPQEVVQKDSLKYIPDVKIDEKTGQLLPYKRRPNPYLQIKKQLPPAAVGQFIAAKRDIELKRYASAESILERLTKEYKNLSGSWYLLGEIGIEKNDLESAEKNFKKAVSVNRKNINAFLRIALVQRMQGKFIEAQNTYVDLLALWRDFPEAHLNLGILYDIYLNQPLEGQRHYEAYHYLTRARNKRVAGWLEEIKARTGKEFILEGRPKKAMSEDKNPGES